MTANDYYELILTEKNNTPSLDILTSDSDVAIWKNMYYNIATLLQYSDDLNNYTLDEMKKVQRASVVGTLEWWKYHILNFFQYSEDDDAINILKLNNNYEYTYDEIDETARIIKYVSIHKSGTTLTIKVATADDDGFPQMLNTDQLFVFQQFINKMMIAGSRIISQSFANDWLIIDAEITLTSTYIPSEIEEKIKLSIKEHLNHLNFAGDITKNGVIDAIQKVEGVDYVMVRDVKCTDNGKSEYVLLNVENKERYTTQSGYAKLDELETIFTFNNI